MTISNPPPLPPPDTHTIVTIRIRSMKLLQKFRAHGKWMIFQILNAKCALLQVPRYDAQKFINSSRAQNDHVADQTRVQVDH